MASENSNQFTDRTSGPQVFVFSLPIEELKKTAQKFIHPETGDVWILNQSELGAMEDGMSIFSITLDQVINSRRSFILPVKVGIKESGISSYADPHSSPPMNQPSRRYSWRTHFNLEDEATTEMQLEVAVFYPRKGT